MNNILSNICDCHIHFGRFSQRYYSTRLIEQAFTELGICRACVMPTGYFSKKEFLECISEQKKMSIENFDSFLWLSPRILRWMSVEKLFLLHKFKAIKIHFVAHPDWYNNQHKIHEVADFAESKKIPIMFHTGDFWFCEPKIFEPICKAHPNTTFIFAHARPITQTIDIMQQYQNVWADTAFTPIESVSLLSRNKMLERVLWGTDFPIYPGQTNYKEAYIERVCQFQRIMSAENFEKVMWGNYKQLFCS